MAMNPMIVKILAQAALKATTDKEARRRILIIILAPTIGILLLTAFIIYIITSPLSLLVGWLLPNELNLIEEFQKDYGYNQSIGIYDNDYITGSGQSYEGIILRTAERK